MHNIRSNYDNIKHNTTKLKLAQNFAKFEFHHVFTPHLNVM